MLIKSFEQGVKVVKKRIGISELFAKPLIALCVCSCYHRKRYKAEYCSEYCDGSYLDDIAYEVLHFSDFLEELCDSLGLKVVFPNSFCCKPRIRFSNPNGDRFVFEPSEDILKSPYGNKIIRDSVISGLFSSCSMDIVKMSCVFIPLCQNAYIDKDDNDILTYVAEGSIEIGKLSINADVSEHLKFFVKTLSETSFKYRFEMEDLINEEV